MSRFNQGEDWAFKLSRECREKDGRITQLTTRNAELEEEVVRLRDYLSVIEKQVSCRGDDYKARVDQLQSIARNALKESGL